MRPLKFSINVALDGCCDHAADGFKVDAELHDHFAGTLASADAPLYGRVTYQMMEEAWRRPDSGTWPDWMEDWMVPFAETIDAAKKYVVSSTLDSVDWNAELVQPDLGEAVRALKDQPGDGIATGGVQLPLALAELGLIDEYEFVVHPTLAGHGPRVFDGLTEHIDLTLVDQKHFTSGAIALRYEPTRPGSLGIGASGHSDTARRSGDERPVPKSE